MRGAGRVVFAATLLLLVGTLNIIYGIGALGNASIYAHGTRYIFTNVHALGWMLILLGALQLGGGLSLIAGNTFGKVIALLAGTLGAIGALFSITDGNPWWSLAVFVLCVYVVHGILLYDDDADAARVA